MTHINDYLNKIHIGDCMDILRQLPDKSVDLVLTDCPYHTVAGGVTGDNKWRKQSYLGNHTELAAGKLFKENDIQFDEWLPSVFRVLKDNTHCYIMINGRNLAKLQTAAESVGFVFQQLLVWDKGNAGPNKWYMNTCEFILMLRKGRAKQINNMGTKNLLKAYNPVGKKTHPTEKPVDLMEIMISNSTQENEIVLDPFSGSSPVAVACLNLNRQFICIEKDQEYHAASVKRLEQAQKNQFLF